MPSTHDQHQPGALAIDNRHARPWMLARRDGTTWRLAWTDGDGNHEHATATPHELREHFTVVTPAPGPAPDTLPTWLTERSRHARRARGR